MSTWLKNWLEARAERRLRTWMRSQVITCKAPHDPHSMRALMAAACGRAP